MGTRKPERVCVPGLKSGNTSWQFCEPGSREVLHQEVVRTHPASIASPWKLRRLQVPPCFKWPLILSLRFLLVGVMIIVMQMLSGYWWSSPRDCSAGWSTCSSAWIMEFHPWNLQKEKASSPKLLSYFCKPAWCSYIQTHTYTHTCKCMCAHTC